MNSINIEIERTKKKFFVQRLQREMDDLEDDDPRKEYLNKIYVELTGKHNDLGTLLDDASLNVYTKKWNKLPNYHKVQKVKEYMDEKYKNDPKRSEIEKLLNTRIKEGKLNSCKFVDYDSIKLKIIKITLSKSEIY